MKGKSITIAVLAIVMLTPVALAGDSAQNYVDETKQQAESAATGLAADAQEAASDAASRHTPGVPGAPASPGLPSPSDDPEDPADEPDTSEVEEFVPDLSWVTAYLQERPEKLGEARDRDGARAMGMFLGAAEFGVAVVYGAYGVVLTAADEAAKNADPMFAEVTRMVDALSRAFIGSGECLGCEEEQAAPAAMAIAAAVTAPVNLVTAAALVAVGSLGLLAGILALARRGIGLGGVALLSRIQSKDIMKNETRANVFDIVKSDPGVALNEIVERLGVSRNAVAYHLAVFESEGQVVSVKDGKYRRYFINGGKFVNGAKDVVSTLKNDTTRHVIEYIQENPGVIQKDVCAALGTSPSATNWHISRLEKVGLVTKNKVANTVQYAPGPSFEKYDLQDFGLRAGA